MDAESQPSTDAGALFWQERRTCFLTTLRSDGTPHLVPVGVTYDPQTRIARVISDGGSKKVRNIRAIEAAGGIARVAVSQAEGRRWCTLEGTAAVKGDPESVAEAELRYAERYKIPRVNPNRVVIEINVTRAMGTAKPSGW
ncbi:TIGR03618 family F420-dependent PPOX class oxidoreductase [Streptomyces sp. NPDC048577]|uniref:TIGR03618 family F420-dependent PPOX class oxidoreductase n=1 Tax=Streptomyces sp. NPDC048577 TaxID=3157209 RepID=UPI003438D9E6